MVFMQVVLEVTRRLVLCTRRAGTRAAVGALILGTAACGDDPFEIRWEAEPDTVLLYSLARPELNLPAGFSFRATSIRPNGRTIVVEAPGSTGQWDVALDTRGDDLVFVLPGTFDIPSRARITSLGSELPFEEVREAPRDTAAYRSREPIEVREGEVYVVQTDTRPGTFGRSCVYYAKLEPLAVDRDAETVRFVYDTSPVCNDRRLVPPN